MDLEDDECDECDECSGEGVVDLESNYNHQLTTIKCPKCDGYGKIKMEV